jgi:hypothetical protein
VIVGNEVLLRQDLTAEELLDYIRRVKAGVDVPVTTAEVAGIVMDDKNRAVFDTVDYLLVHIYPYWDGISIESSAWYVAGIYKEVQKKFNKRVVIGETGWPSAGLKHGDAIPDLANARRFLREWIVVANQESIEYYYFAPFDEKWKWEGGIGSHWGIMTSARVPKFDIASLLAPISQAPPTTPIGGLPQARSSPTAMPVSSQEIFVVYDEWSQGDKFIPSGWMGDISDIKFNDCYFENPHKGDTAIRLDYLARSTEGNNWGGIYWQYPENNWGDNKEGLDLTGFTALSFYARGEKGGEQVSFFSGGIKGQYPDSMDKRGISVTLTTKWQDYHIDLRGADLKHVIGAFGWSASRFENPKGATFYLDDIQFDRTTPPPTPTPLPRPVVPTPTPTRSPCFDLLSGSPLGALFVLDGTLLCANNSPVKKYDMGVDSSGHVYDWLKIEGDALRMDYPAKQLWGTVFLTVGTPAPRGSRASQDFSQCQTLQVDLRATTPNASVKIGMKDKDQPDDGSETKIRVAVSTVWETKSFAIKDFIGMKSSQVYIPIEFVFEEGMPPQTIYFRDVQFVCKPP